MSAIDDTWREPAEIYLLDDGIDDALLERAVREIARIRSLFDRSPGEWMVLETGGISTKDHSIRIDRQRRASNGYEIIANPVPAKDRHPDDRCFRIELILPEGDVPAVLKPTAAWETPDVPSDDPARFRAPASKLLELVAIHLAATRSAKTGPPHGSEDTHRMARLAMIAHDVWDEATIRFPTPFNPGDTGIEGEREDRILRTALPTALELMGAPELRADIVILPLTIHMPELNPLERLRLLATLPEVPR